MILQEMFVEVAKKQKDKVAFIDGTTGKGISYTKALIASIILKDKIALYEEKNIGIMIPTSGGCMIAIIATLMADKVPVIINYSTGAIKNSVFARKKCNFDLIITSSALLEKLELEPLPGMIFIEEFIENISLFSKVKAGVIAKLTTSFIKQMIHIGSEDEIVVILFTSGSEKTPKAVPLTHKNISQQLVSIPQVLEMDENEIFLSCLPLFHVFGFTTMFWLPISFGCTIVTHPNPLEYKKICKSIAKHKATYLVATPSFFRSYLSKADDNTFDSLKVMVSGADNLPENVRLEYLNRFGKEVWQGYGVTEASPVVSTNNREFHKPGSLGKPLPGVEVKIVGIDSGEKLPVGSEGKIMLRGDNIMQGYYRDVEETSYHMHNGWYDTGDMGVLDEDGFLWHRGRLKRFVKIGGEMVSMVAVENALQDFFPDTVLYCVVELLAAKKGSALAIAVTKRTNLNKLRTHLNSKGFTAIYIPKKQIVLKEIPLMGSGKVDFREVQKICDEMEQVR